jgi:Tol biopolymer transport system component
MKLSRFLIVGILLTSLLAACGGPVSVPPTPDVNAIVAQTLQALTAGPGKTPLASTPTSSPSTSLRASLLPRSLYFLNADAAAHAQIFRLATDGRTLKQLSAEPADVTAYDVNQVNGRIVYVSNNQMLLINSDGSGRQVLLDGGPVDQNNPFLTRISNAVWSPNGETIAYGYGGLNLYAVATGVANRVLNDQIRDIGNGMQIPDEMYWPDRFSPDGTKLLVTLGYYEGTSFAIYYPSNNTLVRLKQDDQSGYACCGARWAPDSTTLFSAMPTTGMVSSGLWRIDSTSGQVITLLRGEAGNGTFNFADAPQIGPDGQLYFFFANTPATEEFFMDAPLQLVRSAADGVTGRTILLPDTFKRINEALWSPDAGFVIVALPQNDQTWQGGQAEIVYTDGRPRVVLVPFARDMRWGP